MANIISNSIEIGLEVNPDVVVSYDYNKDIFFITFVATNSGYTVEPGELVDPMFKYYSSIIRKILKGCDTDDEITICITQSATKKIYRIWDANCDIF